MKKRITVESCVVDQAAAGGLNVVVVDDSVVIREHVVESLVAVQGVGSVRQAGDVPSGLVLLEARRPDLMVLDIEMPGQTGLDLLKIVRSTNKSSVIIMFSIYDHPQLRKKCKDLGANYYFHKLNEFECVAEVCRSLIEGAGVETEGSIVTEQE